MSDPVVAFIRARLDEEEHAVYHHTTTAEHLSRHGPAQVLREAAAKREILDMWEAANDRRSWVDSKEFHDGRDPDERQCDEDIAAALDAVVEALAATWAHHPDYAEFLAE